MAERIEAMFRVDGHRALVTGAPSGLGRRFAASLDVTDPASIVACFDEIERRTGGPADSVVNKAGVTVTKSVLMQCEKTGRPSSART